MANILSKDKQAMVIHALAEGSSIRSVERMTGIHRDTIMRLGVRVGNACREMMDDKLMELTLKNVQVDEIWGFIGKKQRIVTKEDSKEVGDVWTFLAMDTETKLIPSHVIGKRDMYHATVFMDDLAARVTNRIQLSSDGLKTYVAAVERSFGSNVDYGQNIKVYASKPSGRYSAPEVLRVDKVPVSGSPDMAKIGTSYIEKQNHTLRMHCRRLTRLTNAFSKKLDNFKAAVALNLAYHNFVKIHSTIRCTPAMAAGVESSQWNVSDLVALA